MVQWEEQSVLAKTLSLMNQKILLTEKAVNFVMSQNKLLLLNLTSLLNQKEGRS